MGMAMVLAVTVAEFCVSHCHQFDEEEREHGHEADPFDPGISSDGASQTWIR
jgi:hypothetical protein